MKIGMNINKFRRISLLLVAAIVATMFIYDNSRKKRHFLVPTEIIQISKTNLAKKVAAALTVTSTSLIKNETKIKNSLQTLDKATPPASTNVEDIEANISLADALIATNPDSYFAYKAKMINLLKLELVYKKEANLDEYSNLYTELLKFNDNFESDDKSDPNFILKSEELKGIDDDLVHIPFLRLSALNENSDLAAMASEYIDTYPNSYVGYLYMAEAFWNIQEKRAALETFKKTVGTDVSDENAYQILELLMKRSPIDRISSMMNQL